MSFQTIFRKTTIARDDLTFIVLSILDFNHPGNRRTRTFVRTIGSRGYRVLYYHTGNDQLGSQQANGNIYLNPQGKDTRHLITGRCIAWSNSISLLPSCLLLAPQLILYDNAGFDPEATVSSDSDICISAYSNSSFFLSANLGSSKQIIERIRLLPDRKPPRC